MKFVLVGLGWAWAAWVTVTLYGCAARILEVRDMLKRQMHRTADEPAHRTMRARPLREPA